MCLRLHKKFNTLILGGVLCGVISLQASFCNFWGCKCCYPADILHVVIDESAEFMEFNGRVDAVVKKNTEAILVAASKSRRLGGRPAVIFDIDGTVFHTDNKSKSEKPIFAVLEFYNLLQQENIKCIFLTARLNSIAAETKRHLKAVGYRHWVKFISMDFADRSMCNPADDGFALFSIPSWKQQKRVDLALCYNIIATLDDRSENLQGLNVGVPVKIPPYSIFLDDDALDDL